MDGNLIVLAVFVIFMFCACVCMVIYFMKRERVFAGKIQSMLDDAVSGKLLEKHLDESRISVVENTMWNYLCSHEVAARALEKEKEQSRQKH